MTGDEAAATRLLGWREAEAAVPVPGPEARPADAAAAYRVQDALARGLAKRRGWRPIG